MGQKHILKNLHSLIRNSALSYMNEFVWQDIELTTEFKNAYERYLKKSNYDIEFLGATAVITSPYAKYIYVPNQWFVIASYAIETYEELQKYKEFFKKVANHLKKQPETYAKQLRDSASLSDRTEFVECAKEIFLSFCSDENLAEESSCRLWRFVTDYSWWSGQKTIDRGDFYVSVILNMLNLVNTSQGYVADIVNAYANDIELKNLTASIDAFTVNMETLNSNYDCLYETDKEIRGSEENKSDGEETIPRPETAKIRISGTNALKEIKLKG